MYPISNAAKARFLSGQKQIARLTVLSDTFEKYEGEVYTVPFSFEGENIFTRDNETDGQRLNSSGEYQAVSGWAVSDYLPASPQKRYVIEGVTFDSTAGVYHAFYDSTQTLIETQQYKQEGYISPPGTAYMRVSYRKSYAPTSIHISVGTVVNATLNVKTGVLTVDSGFISNLGSYTWRTGGSGSSYAGIYRTYPLSGAFSSSQSADRTKGILSSEYKLATNVTITSMNDLSMLINNQLLYFRNNDISTTAAITTAMDGVQAFYPLENPCIYQLTAQDVRTLLGSNNIWSEAGTVTLEYRDTSGAYKSAQGTMVSFDDGAKNISLRSLSVALTYTQDGTGDASPTNPREIHGYTSAAIHRTGKNTFDANAYTGQEGITKNADGTWSGKQSAFSGVGQIAGNYEPNTAYYVAMTVSTETASGGNLRVVFYYTDGSTGRTDLVQSGDTIVTVDGTTSASKTLAGVSVAYGSGGSNDMTLYGLYVIPASLKEEDVVITDAKILEGSLSVNRYCTTGKAVMVGSCVASEMDAKIDNEDGAFNDVQFIGKDIKVEVGTIDDNDNPDYIPLGIFQVDDCPKKLSIISLTTLDRMMLMEVKIDREKLSFPVTVADLFDTICIECGVEVASGITLPNGTYQVMEFPENLETYRDILSCICEITGTCAYFDWEGKLRLEWFNPTPAVELNTHNRVSSDFAEETVIITGVEIKAEEGDYIAGDDGFLLSIAQNPLVTHDYQDLADSLYALRGGFAYKPFTAVTLPMPYLYPLDTATFIDRDGNESTVAITDWTFKLNRNTSLRGRGESSKSASFQKKYGIGENGATIDEALGILRDTIIKNAEVINESMQTLERTLHGEYEALSSEFGSYKNETDAKITANAEGITQAYTNIEEIDSKYGVAVTNANEAIVQLADGNVAVNTKFREVTEAYIKSGKLYYEGVTPVYGVAVGQLTYETIGDEKLIKRSGVYSVFTSEELAFYIDDVKVAYMRNKKLYINEAEFVAAAKIGRYAIEDGANGFTIKYGG